MAMSMGAVARPGGAVLRRTWVPPYPSMSPRAQFGELVRRYRQAAELTQEQLAEKVGTKKATISEIEGRQRRIPDHELAAKLVRMLNKPELLLSLDYPIEFPERSWDSALIDHLMTQGTSEDEAVAFVVGLRRIMPKRAAS